MLNFSVICTHTLPRPAQICTRTRMHTQTHTHACRYIQMENIPCTQSRESILRRQVYMPALTGAQLLNCLMQSWLVVSPIQQNRDSSGSLVLTGIQAFYAVKTCSTSYQNSSFHSAHRHSSIGVFSVGEKLHRASSVHWLAVSSCASSQSRT